MAFLLRSAEMKFLELFLRVFDEKPEPLRDSSGYAHE